MSFCEVMMSIKWGRTDFQSKDLMLWSLPRPSIMKKNAKVGRTGRTDIQSDPLMLSAHAPPFHHEKKR